MMSRTILTRGDEPEVEPVVTCTAERGCVRTAVKPLPKVQPDGTTRIILYCAWHLEMLERPRLFASRDPEGNLYIPPNGAASTPKVQGPGSLKPEVCCRDCGRTLSANDGTRCRACYDLHVKKEAKGLAARGRKCPDCGHPMPRGSQGKKCWNCWRAEFRETVRRERELLNRAMDSMAQSPNRSMTQ